MTRTGNLLIMYSWAIAFLYEKFDPLVKSRSRVDSTHGNTRRSFRIAEKDYHFRAYSQHTNESPVANQYFPNFAREIVRFIVHQISYPMIDSPVSHRVISGQTLDNPLAGLCLSQYLQSSLTFMSGFRHSFVTSDKSFCIESCPRHH